MNTLIRTEVDLTSWGLEEGRWGAASELLYYWWCSSDWVERWAHDVIKSIDCLIKFKQRHEPWAKEDCVTPLYALCPNFHCTCSYNSQLLTLIRPFHRCISAVPPGDSTNSLSHSNPCTTWKNKGVGTLWSLPGPKEDGSQWTKVELPASPFHWFLVHVGAELLLCPQCWLAP